MDEKRNEYGNRSAEDRDHGSTQPGMTGLPDIMVTSSQQAGRSYPHRPEPGTRPEEGTPDTPIRNNDIYGNSFPEH
ncbi:hypothetical protein V9K67_20425 [Paraflavisolibacter sp. H34]|uniref:hypothetical protein n=1 Tax=Huijunlia imazamoxiresistens TaxID=3127457 RepID=UPI00301AD047